MADYITRTVWGYNERKTKNWTIVLV
jgi:hypothetical protein